MPTNWSNFTVSTDKIFYCSHSVREANIFKCVHVVDKPEIGQCFAIIACCQNIGLLSHVRQKYLQNAVSSSCVKQKAKLECRYNMQLGCRCSLALVLEEELQMPFSS